MPFKDLSSPAVNVAWALAGLLVATQNPMALERALATAGLWAGGRRIVESLTNVHGAGGTPKELDASICKLAPRCSATAAHKRLHPWLGGTLVTLRHCAVGFWWLVVWRKRVVLQQLAQGRSRFIAQEFATIGELGKHVIQAWDD